MGTSWFDVEVSLVAGSGCPVAKVAGLVTHALPVGELARVVAQLGFDQVSQWSLQGSTPKRGRATWL